MTREEFINWFDDKFALTKNDIYEFGQLYDEVTKPHWISVEEELPKDGQHTATINKAGFQAMRHYKGGKWFSSYGNEYGDITHWMPLPEMPILSNLENIGKDLKGGKE